MVSRTAIRFPKTSLPFQSSTLLTLQADKIYLYCEGDPKPHILVQMAAGRWVHEAEVQPALSYPDLWLQLSATCITMRTKCQMSLQKNSFPNLLKIYSAPCYRYC